MTYASTEASTESGKPIELYTISLGTTTYHYCSPEDSQVIGGVTYTPIAISRGKLEVTQEQRANVVEITVPADNPFAVQYIGTIPGQQASLTISRFHRGDGQVVQFFTGYIQSVSFQQDARVAILSVVPTVGALSRNILRFTYQAACNHVLYDARCKVDENAFKLTGLVTAVSSNTITVAGANSFPSGYFTAGRVDTGNDSRLVLAHVGSLITLLLPFGTNPLGSTVNVFAGCGHDPDTCNSKFGNVINYGGFKMVPLKDIFSTGLT